MSAARIDRIHSQQIELAMESRVAGDDLRDLTGRLAAKDARTRTFLRALVDAQTEGDALRALIAARADHVIDVSTELAGLLEVGEPSLFRKFTGQPLPSHNPAAAADAVAPSTVSPAVGVSA